MKIDTLRDRLAGRFTSLDYVAQTGSTNADLLDRDELPDRTVLLAGHQTAGRGRLGRSFTAPADTQLIFSVGLRPGEEALARLGLLPLVAGLAFTDVIEGAALKWPNDVLMSGGKVCGILAEAEGLGQSVSPRVVLGCGLNVTIPQEELPVPTATSLAVAGSPLADLALEELAARILLALDERVRQWEHGEAKVVEDYRLASATLGEPVRVETASGILEGVAEDIAADGQLVVVTSDDEHRTFSAGDVTHLRPWRPQR